mgnify:FL=1
MNFSGNYIFKNAIDKIWADLNNPKLLKEAIPGCKEFTEKNKNIYFLKLEVKVGPFNAVFTGELKIKNIVPPFSYEIEAKGNAGQLGGGSGVVEIELKEEDTNTNLSYKANTKINGKIAQLGARLVEGSVKKNTTLFFNNFEKLTSKSQELESHELDIKQKKLENKISLNKLNKKYIYFLVIIVVLFLIINYE